MNLNSRPWIRNIYRVRQACWCSKTAISDSYIGRFGAFLIFFSAFDSFAGRHPIFIIMFDGLHFGHQIGPLDNPLRCVAPRQYNLHMSRPRIDQRDEIRFGNQPASKCHIGRVGNDHIVVTGSKGGADGIQGLQGLTLRKQPRPNCRTLIRSEKRSNALISQYGALFINGR